MQATSESTTNHAAATAAAIDTVLQIVPPTSAAAFPLDATTLMMRPVVAPHQKKVKKDATPVCYASHQSGEKRENETKRLDMRKLFNSLIAFGTVDMH